MTITWHGFSCFKIQEQTRDTEVALVTDPFEPEDGKKLSRALAADIVTVSHDHSRHNNIEAVQGVGDKAPFIIKTPGEFEVKDVFVTGVSTFHDMVDGKEKGRNTMYYITVGDVHIVHLGDLKHALEEKHLEDFHNIDVLMIPVGGGDVLDAKQAADIVNQLEPRVVVPMHYRVDGFGAKFDAVDPFLKALGMTRPEPLAKLKLAKKDLPQEDRHIVLLEPQ